ncbi:MAG: T9SS type A sorting domain-containing protein [candidate division KSB1 bacterium]|nr:T9SS type A sorting domain-containing protein [candidate division KSB1 bacterium]MDZ7305073.1 T9SS type A sorting domain-containing protein [candidate division KSB1 bacterium]MDZ7313557.1 T9SS type A sorting domain-containing protein [candidate division KSB1 bacterium]
MKRGAGLRLTLGFIALLNATATTQTIYFDDTSPNSIRLGNASFYEIGLRKTNGSIIYLTDKTTGQKITLGSRYEQLWGAVFSVPGGESYVGGANYNPSGPNKFSYTWSEANKILTLNYQPNLTAAKQLTVEATIIASAETYFDLQMQVQNNWGNTLDRVLFPSDLVFQESEIEEALLPLLPGVILEQPFFAQHRTYTTRYPGYPGVFSDYVSLKLHGGYLALYLLYDDRPVPIIDFGFVHDDAYLPNTTFFTHVFRLRLDNGKEWKSPVMRIRVAEPHQATIEHFRVDNRFDQLPSVADKLGTDFQRVAKSPLLKADLVQIAFGLHIRKFTDYDSLLSQQPTPAIFHPVAFQPGGFDNNYPDFLPPNSAFGTTAELRDLFVKAQKLGLLVMPYTNPTWWDDESPTLRNLPPPLTINDIAVIDANGRPVYEYYGRNGGYVVSPCHPFVVQRIDKMVQEMTTDHPSDFLFEDQIGARPVLYDFNKACPSPLGYIQGWLEHTRKHSTKQLATELGFDRLLETETAFHGSVLLPERLGYTAQWWGTGNWRYYPFTSLLSHDKALFYQHDLAPETMTTNKATLSWNLAFGYMLSYDLFTGHFNAPAWREVVATFQAHVASRYAGEKMIDYFILQEGVAQSNFESVNVIANGTPNSYVTGAHTIPSQGTLVTSKDGSLTAGIFTNYNNKPLSSGDHYLIIEKSAKMDSILVWQPLGNDTPLSIERPAIWPDPLRIHVYAVARDTAIEVAKSVTAARISFDWKNNVAGANIIYYKLTSEIVIAVEDKPLEPPAEIRLFQNYPNPFNAATRINFALPHESHVKLEVFNLVGEKIATLADGQFDTGYHFINFSATNLPSGVYVYRMKTKQFVETRKLVVVR